MGPSALVTLIAHHTPAFISCALVRYYLRPVSVIFGIYVAVKVKPCLIYKIIWQWIDLTTTHCFTETTAKNVHVQQSLPPGDFAQRYICMVSKEAIFLMLSVPMTLTRQVSMITVLKIFMEMLPIPLQGYVMFLLK